MEKFSADQVCEALGLEKGVKYTTPEGYVFSITDKGFKNEEGLMCGGDVSLIIMDLLYKKHFVTPVI